MSSNIKPGYLLKVTTWENDGDNYNTVDMDGLTEAQVRFYLHVSKKFTYDNVTESFGNEEVHGEAFNVGMIEHIKTYEGEVPAEWQFQGDDDTDLDDDDFFYDLLGNIGIHSTEYGFWRVVEDCEVFLVPEAIKNVTSQFQ